MATAPILPISEEENNYLRMNLLLNYFSAKAARVLFDNEFHPTRLNASITIFSNRLMDLRKKGLINSSQWRLLFPSNGVPDSKYFDVILMITLIRNLASLPAPASEYDQLPLSADTTTTDDLTRIEYYKPKMAQFDDRHMGSTYFSTSWNDIIGAIRRLGGPDMAAECESLKTKQFPNSTQHSGEEKLNEKKPIRFYWGESWDENVMNLRSLINEGKKESNMNDANPNLQKIPTHDALINLSKQIGNCAIELGIELGLKVAEIEHIAYTNDKNLQKLIEDILLNWKEKSKEKTVRNLLMALERVEKGGFNCLKKC